MVWEAVTSEFDTVVPDQTQEDLKNYISKQAEENENIWKVFQNVEKLQKKAEELKETNPEEYRELMASMWYLDFFWLWIVWKWAKSTGEIAQNIWKKWVEQIKNQVDTWLSYLENLKDKAKKVIPEVKEKVEDFVKPKKDLDWTIKEVFNATDNDLWKLKTSINSVDTEWIQTYSDFSRKVWEKITDLSKKQDEMLDTVDTKYWIDDLETTSSSWKYTTNYVKQALDDMENLAKVTNDIDYLDKIWILKTKDSFTLKEINDLVREYWYNFKNKAFNKDWTAKIWWIWESYENTRTWLKNLVREKFWTDELKNIDSEISSLYKADDMIWKMEKKVQNLKNKITERSLWEKLWNMWWKIMDFLTLWTAKWFMNRFFPSNVWLKVMNSLNIEENLVDNLKRINKLLKNESKMTDEEFKKWIEDFIENVSSKKTKSNSAWNIQVNNNVNSSKQVVMSKNDALLNIRDARTDLENLAKQEWLDIIIKTWTNEYKNTLRFLREINKTLTKKRDLKPWEVLQRTSFEQKVYKIKQKIVEQVINDIKQGYIKWRFTLSKHWNDASIKISLWSFKFETHLPLRLKFIPNSIKYWISKLQKN